MPGKGEIFRRSDGRWAFRVKAANGQIVATGQGYAAKRSARHTLERLLAGAYNGPIHDLDG